MNPSLSAFVDLCRIAAACVVLFGHLDALGFVPLELHGRPNRLGHDAVILFFVLSGLVISHAAATTQRTARAYAVARAARVYSVAVPAVLATYALDRIGMHLAPSQYPSWQYAHWPLHMAYQWLFLGEAWTATSVVPFSNVPYWSLSYEVWYYALFGAAVLVRGPARWWLTAAALAAMGPKPWLLLPAWLAGVGLHRVLTGSERRAGAAPGRAIVAGTVTSGGVAACAGTTASAGMGAGARRTVALVAITAGAAGYALLATTGAQGSLELIGQRLLNTAYARTGLDALSNLGYSRMFLADWAGAASFVLVLAGVARRAAPVPAWLARAAAGAAGMSFTLYLLHYPLLTLLRASGAFAPGWGSAALAAAIVLAAAALAAQVFERRRGPWRRLFGAAWDAVVRRRPAR